MVVDNRKHFFLINHVYIKHCHHQKYLLVMEQKNIEYINNMKRKIHKFEIFWNHIFWG